MNPVTYPHGQISKESKEYKLQQEWLKKNKIKQCKPEDTSKHQTGAKMTTLNQRGL